MTKSKTDKQTDKTPARPTLKPGDVVRAISGGPKMTIGRIFGNSATCAWFDRDHRGDWGPLNQRDISLDAIELAK